MLGYGHVPRWKSSGSWAQNLFYAIKCDDRPQIEVSVRLRCEDGPQPENSFTLQNYRPVRPTARSGAKRHRNGAPRCDKIWGYCNDKDCLKGCTSSPGPTIRLEHYDLSLCLTFAVNSFGLEYPLGKKVREQDPVSVCLRGIKATFEVAGLLLLLQVNRLQKALGWLVRVKLTAFSVYLSRLLGFWL